MVVQAFQPPPPPFLYLSKRRFSRGSLSSFPFDLNSESQTLLYSMYSADLRASRCIVRFILSTFTLLLLSFFLLRLGRKKLEIGQGLENFSSVLKKLLQPPRFIVRK